MQDLANIGWLVVRIAGGTIAAIIGYAICRRLLDATGLEQRFQSGIWRHSVTQFGEVILVILAIGTVIIGAIAVGVLRALLE